MQLEVSIIEEPLIIVDEAGTSHLMLGLQDDNHPYFLASNHFIHIVIVTTPYETSWNIEINLWGVEDHPTQMMHINQCVAHAQKQTK